MDEKLKLAGQAYKNGCTCSQAVFCAFAHDMGLDETTVYKIMEGFGGGRYAGGMRRIQRRCRRHQLLHQQWQHGWEKQGKNLQGDPPRR